MGYPKQRRQARSSPPSPPTPGLRPQAPPERLAALQFTHARLLKAIADKKRSLDKLDARIEETATRMAALGPVRDQLVAIDVEVHGLFKDLLSRRHQPREGRRALTFVYEFLRRSGVLSPRGLWDDDGAPPGPRQGDADAGPFPAEGEGGGQIPPRAGGGFSAQRPSNAPDDQS